MLLLLFIIFSSCETALSIEGAASRFCDYCQGRIDEQDKTGFFFYNNILQQYTRDVAVENQPYGRYALYVHATKVPIREKKCNTSSILTRIY